MDFLKKLFLFEAPKTSDEFILKDNVSNIVYDVRKNTSCEKKKISSDYEENLRYIEKRFSVPKNNDFVVRKFKIFNNTKAFLIFYDGMSDSNLIDQSVIETLLEIPQFSKNAAEEEIIEKLVSHCQAMKVEEFDQIIDDVNFGSAGLFVDNVPCGFSIDVRNWGHRGIDKPEIEQSIYGPQEAFNEMLRNSSALVRKILKTEKLICEGTKIGKVSQTRGVIMYISDIANDDLVNEVKRRIDAITIDYVIAIEEVAHLLEDKTYMLTNTCNRTAGQSRTSTNRGKSRVSNQRKSKSTDISYKCI